ncbi:zona pellucida glycoprotein 2, tandem duplicate 5 precursor [Silurus asotus]|uniref:Zona pellucida sperm-binding protein 4 n=1 Tax=Silurus asotus TaxID=30991 RepID=A0AAD5AD98_SILAS|nr:zona pellucida glycoprotein 2, tandem duplicate 5 precursor [Silurus asotus]
MVASGVRLGLVGVLLAVTFVSSSPAAPPGVKVPFHDPQVLPKPTLQPQMPGFVQQCQVKDYERVPCGEPGVQAARCNSLNCCFDGQQCYYGKTEQVAYNSYYSVADYPVTKILREPVYVEVHILGRTDPNIVLVLNGCWATASPNPYSSRQWDLLVNGCPYKDDRYLTKLVPVNETSGLAYPTHYRRFVFKMFTFVDETAKAPLHETEEKLQQKTLLTHQE